MPRNVSSYDTLGKCNHYSDPYGVRRFPSSIASHPNMRKGTMETADKLESERTKRDKELLQKFISKNDRIQNESGHLIIKAGRFLFLGSMVPLYLLLVKLPYLTFLQGLPFLFSKGQQGLKALMQATYFWMMQLLAPIKKVLKKITNYIEKAITKTQEFFSQLFEKTMTPFKFIKSKWNQVARSMKQLFSIRRFRGLGKVFQNVKKTFENIQSIFKKSYTFLAESFHPFISFMSLIIKKIPTSLSFKQLKNLKLSNSFQKLAHAMSLPIQNMFQKTGALINRSKQWLQSIRKNVQQKILEWTEPFLNKFQEVIEATRRRLSEALESAKEKSNKVQEFSKKLFLPIVGAFNQISFFIFPPFIRNPFQKIRKRQRSFFKKMKEKFNAMKGKFQRMSKHIQQSWNALKRRTYSYFQKILEKLLRLLTKMLFNIKVFLKFTLLIPRIVVFGLLKVFRFLIQFCRWLKVFVKYCIFIVRQHGQQWINQRFS